MRDPTFYIPWFAEDSGHDCTRRPCITHRHEYQETSGFRASDFEDNAVRRRHHGTYLAFYNAHTINDIGGACVMGSYHGRCRLRETTCSLERPHGTKSPSADNRGGMRTHF